MLRTHVLLLTAVIYIFPLVEGGINWEYWDKCNCYWGTWEAWSTCNSECNGQQKRSRSVWLYENDPNCPFEFETCASGDMGWDYSRCNAFCHNGGTSDSYSCSCVTGFYGSCCGFQVNCGDPGSITNGYKHGTTYTYGSTISYGCNTGYQLMDGSTTRTCQLSATWNGTKPRCAYMDSCSSSPCKNDAPCTNIPDDFSCTCTPGWSGKQCDVDIQPPIVTNCSENILVRTSSLTDTVEWQIPTFTDPHELDVTISGNYPSNRFEFPWGDFVVSYNALKPTNGLTKDCTFDIKLRPHPCDPLEVPSNGSLICNNWKTDYGMICILFCKEHYTVPRGTDPSAFYVCGASGAWTPRSQMPNCSVRLSSYVSTTGYKLAQTFASCSSDIRTMQEYYIEKLKQSDFSYFCDKYTDECIPENVDVQC